VNYQKKVDLDGFMRNYASSRKLIMVEHIKIENNFDFAKTSFASYNTRPGMTKKLV
jgi:hypothetical protein